MCSVQGNVTVEVRALYKEPINYRQPENSMHERAMHLCSTVFTFRMHLAVRHVQSVHDKQDIIVLTRGK